MTVDVKRNFWHQTNSTSECLAVTCLDSFRHKIAEELGQSHNESSFYQALHDGTVKGTCMILDEKVQHGATKRAMMLKNRWQLLILSCDDCVMLDDHHWSFRYEIARLLELRATFFIVVPLSSNCG